MSKWIRASNAKWAVGWLALAGLALGWWQPFRSITDNGPPWIYGNPGARFTLALYADLECSYSRDYLPQLQRWIVTNDHVNLAWHHLPFPQHEPAASREARLVECVGQLEGREGFWGAVTWIYQHTQGAGGGLATDTTLPYSSPSLKRCLASEQVAQSVDAQKAEALQNGLSATPTLRLIDNRTQRTFTLQGPIEPDALLSAVDLLSAPDISEMPAEVISDMPR